MRSRIFVAVALAVWSGASVGADRAAASGEKITGTVTLSHRILRDGSPIGEHRYTFSTDGATLTVTSSASAALTLLGVPVYRFTQQVRETWRDGRLLAFDAHTNDNGTILEVRGQATAQGLAIDGPKGHAVVPANAAPTTYWSTATTHGVPLIDTRDGSVTGSNVIPLGWDQVAVPGAPPVDAQRFHVHGPFRFDVWYDSDGLWRKAAFNTEHGHIEDVPSQVTGDRALLMRILSVQFAALGRRAAPGLL